MDFIDYDSLHEWLKERGFEFCVEQQNSDGNELWQVFRVTPPYGLQWRERITAENQAEIYQYFVEFWLRLELGRRWNTVGRASLTEWENHAAELQLIREGFVFWDAFNLPQQAVQEPIGTLPQQMRMFD